MCAARREEQEEEGMGGRRSGKRKTGGEGGQIACLGEQKTKREASGTAARADRGSVDRLGVNFGPKVPILPNLLVGVLQSCSNQQLLSSKTIRRFPV